ncbi:hypothetical protein F7725_006835 [Dissostichus mawsoni]|uniref:Uncharacterized protein n=1 Tax=Dissostichus mawsoni TaxID=36200 RepID=A0A7J5XVZ8_DISMA|nr:hypothetical protein F7725_006835 [Dissostichus mawsoni]
MSSNQVGGECVWGRRGGGPPGRVDGSVWGICVEARGGRPLPSQTHRCISVSNGGAVRTADQRSEGSSRHGRPQPAQPVEGHGGRLHEAQRDPHGQPGLQPPPHRVLSFTCLISPFLSSHLFTIVLLPLSRITHVPATYLIYPSHQLLTFIFPGDFAKVFTWNRLQ